MTKRWTRREVIKKAAYIPPIILTLPAMLSFSSAGSSETNPGDTSGSGDPGGLTAQSPSRGGLSCNFTSSHGR